MLKDKLDEVLPSIQIESICDHPKRKFRSFARIWYVMCDTYVEMHIASGCDDVWIPEESQGDYYVVKFRNMYDVFKFLLSANWAQMKYNPIKRARVWMGMYHSIHYIADMFLENKPIESEYIYCAGKCVPKLPQEEQIRFFSDLEEENHNVVMEILAKYNDDLLRLLARPLAENCLRGLGDDEQLKVHLKYS